MAKLINGNGNKAIWAAQDADLIASICGNVTGIAAVGSKFSYTQEDANTIGVADGVIITKEGRRIQLDAGNVDLFTIPTGQLNVTSYYIIGYKLVQNSDTTQTCETFVQKMDNATDVITEDTFRGGATEVYVSLYRVTQVGMNIDTVDLLLPSMNDLADIINALSPITITMTPSSETRASSDLSFKRMGKLLVVTGTCTVTTTYAGWLLLGTLPLSIINYTSGGSYAPVNVIYSGAAELFRINGNLVYIQGNVASTSQVNAVFWIDE